MIFRELPLQGAFVIEPELRRDERGFFTRTFCVEEFAQHGLETAVNQCSTSHNVSAGTLRGMHWQAAPHGEVKLVSCGQGAIFDVIVDVRPKSPSFGRWESVELSAENRRMLYVPEGFAHGMQTLMDRTDVLYQISAPFHPEASRGLHWDDPELAIPWPVAPERILSERDQNLPLFKDLNL
jgi:dTDP-4-dehydrorhamnose 3,5-epimerase